jgi:hypothetical protein
VIVLKPKRFYLIRESPYIRITEAVAVEDSQVDCKGNEGLFFSFIVGSINTPPKKEKN